MVRLPRAANSDKEGDGGTLLHVDTGCFIRHVANVWPQVPGSSVQRR